MHVYAYLYNRNEERINQKLKRPANYREWVRKR